MASNTPRSRARDKYNKICQLKQDLDKKILKLKRAAFTRSGLETTVKGFTTRMETEKRHLKQLEDQSIQKYIDPSSSFPFFPEHADNVHKIYSKLVALERDIDEVRVPVRRVVRRYKVRVPVPVPLYEGQATLVTMSEDSDDDLNLLPLEEEEYTNATVVNGRMRDKEIDNKIYARQARKRSRRDLYEGRATLVPRWLDEDTDRAIYEKQARKRSRRDNVSAERDRNVAEGRMRDREIDKKLSAKWARRRQRRKK